MTSSQPLSTSVGIDQVDADSVVLYLDCPGTQVVMLQALFDIYEAVGVVRTIDIRNSLVCILTTPSMLQDCLAVLEGIRDKVQWSFVPVPSEDLKQRYLGYGKKGL